ncbi:hypothetical protein [Streptomyces sp. NPDC093589]|uniref:hypothetical protein n=1 Tax=Streptomyces sp. NPDC093589 TaxID=3366043 RepID=UPI003819CFF9
MLIAPAAVVALLLLVGLLAAVRRLRRALAAERTARRLSEAQLHRDIEALTADAHHRAPAVRVLDVVRQVIDAEYARYTHTRSTDTEGDGDV